MTYLELTLNLINTAKMYVDNGHYDSALDIIESARTAFDLAVKSNEELTSEDIDNVYTALQSVTADIDCEDANDKADLSEDLNMARVIHQKTFTLVEWEDGEKTAVSYTGDEVGGVALCMLKRLLGEETFYNIFGR